MPTDIKYVALLRGITPTNPKMRNQKLQAEFERLGFQNVKGVISSGNIIFSTPRTDVAEIESDLEQIIKANLGFTTSAIIRTQKQLKSVMANDPFKSFDHSPNSYLTVTFLQKPAPSPATKQAPPNSFTIVKTTPSEICGVTNTSLKSPNPMTYLEKQYGKQITTRTSKTVERLIRMME